MSVPEAERMELLAPGGDLDSIKAAVAAGADAVYCGLDRFNARNRAANIRLDDLNGIVRLAHNHSCEVFLALNILIVENEIPALLTLLNKLVNTGIDGVIVQDFGLLHILSTLFPTLAVHASTQLTTHNIGQIHFLHELSAKRVNLCRELSLAEIGELTEAAHYLDCLTEVFVHGANCISFSGLCYMSSVHGGNSGNRGRCSQPCRDQYEKTAAGSNFPLNLKDNSAYADIGELAAIGVDSIKIEGRIKKFHYVYAVVKAFRNQLNRFYSHEEIQTENSNLRTVFNRDLSNGLLKGAIGKSMFIDNPRDHSAIHLARQNGGETAAGLEQAKRELYDKKTEIITEVREKIAQLHSGDPPDTLGDLLKGERKVLKPVVLPKLQKLGSGRGVPRLSILISSMEDIALATENDVDIYFQLPARLDNRCAQYEQFFRDNPTVLPWFPAVLIGEEYMAAVKFLQLLQPKSIVSNNSGIAYEAWKAEIPWTAGPYLNCVNSYSLTCLQEKFKCSGAFISNELSRMQIRSIKKPDTFNLYYSIYHPIRLMSSRHCLFQQVDGCKKTWVDDRCIPDCEKSAVIRNLKETDIILSKTKGNYHSVYNGINLLNTDIVTEVQELFSSFFVDMRDVKTKTGVGGKKEALIALFAGLVRQEFGTAEMLSQILAPTTNEQYKKGI